MPRTANPYFADASMRTEAKQDEPLTRLIEAEQVRLLYAHAPTALMSMIFSAAALCFFIQERVSSPLTLAWLVFVGVVTIARAVLIYRYRQQNPPLDTVPRWRHFFILGAGAAGLVWFSAGAVLFSQTSSSAQFAFLFILTANAVGSMAFLAPVPVAFLAFFLPTIAIVAFHATLVSDTPLLMGALTLFFIAAFISTAHLLSTSVAQALRLRFENTALVQDLQTITERFELALQGTNEGVWDASFVATTPGQFAPFHIYYSQRFKALLGFADHEFPHTLESWRTRLHPEDRARVFHALHAHLIQKIPYAVEYRMRTKAGEYRWFSGGGQAVWNGAGLPVRMAGSLQDITSRKEVEQLKDELVSTVSHELRTPLTSLRGFAELMLARCFSTEKQREFLSVIYKEATRLTDLINDFLDIQRMESGRQSYEFGPVAIAPLLHDAITVFINDAARHTFVVESVEELPIIQADIDRIRQVLINLVSNAVKYSPQGGRITLGARQSASEIVVWVADEGVGIPPGALPRLFSKFYRVDSRDTRSIGGTGLGLSLVKKIIEAHEGRVWVESTVDVGSTFFFTLPIASQPPVFAHQEPALL